MMRLEKMLLLAGLLCMSQANAQSQIPAEGTLVLVKANGEVTAPNDEAVIVFGVEERDSNKAAAASRVNEKMKQGIDIVRRADPTAKLKTAGYSTYAIYREEKQGYTGERVQTGWQVSQNLEVETRNLANLPKLAAAVQGVLGVEDTNFRVSRQTAKRLDEERIVATYRDLNDRIGFIAKAMGRKVSDTVLEAMDYESSGDNTLQRVIVTGSRISRRERTQVQEPSFEPGETTLNMKLVGKVRFK